ncbi:MAG: HDOD domain-containing protein [Pseudomonadota bacterium]
MKDIFIGRQAIFNRNMEVYAYELLFRSGQHNCSNVTQQLNGDSATSQVLLNTFMEIGLERIAGPHLIFVNLTRNLLLDHPEFPFPKDRVVLEVLEDTPIDQQLLDSVSQLSQQGYQLALDDYIFEPKWDRLLSLVDIIKVEVPAVDLERIQEELPKLRSHGLKLLAEKIETEEEYQQMLDLGFDYFQGYHFSRPKILQGRRLEENSMVILRLVSELNNPEITIEKLESLITQDASLSYKILRYINSAAIGMPRKVESIRQAVIYMGLGPIRAWASLLALTRLENNPQAHFTTGLVRAHMCQQLVTRAQGCPPETGFTVGLLSILDLLMDSPMTEIIKELSLADEIKIALLEQQGVAGEALRCTLAYEIHDWNDIGLKGIQQEEIIDIYLNACEQAFTEQQALKTA